MYWESTRESKGSTIELHNRNAPSHTPDNDENNKYSRSDVQADMNSLQNQEIKSQYSSDDVKTVNAIISSLPQEVKTQLLSAALASAAPYLMKSFTNED